MNPDQIRRLTDVETPVLNGYHINENVKKAIESGDREQYCQDLVTKLTQRTHSDLKSVFELVTKMKDQVFTIVREKNRIRKQGGNNDKDQGRGNVEFEQFPNSFHEAATKESSR